MSDWLLENYDRQTTEKPNVETEIRRLQALKTFGLLDEPTEPCFERFTSLAARLFGTPMALLTLVDLGRTFVVAQTGLHGWLATEREVSRKTSFCAHAILSVQPVLIVKDAATDVRFADTPLVRDYGVRFYAGAPLITPEGYRLGCLSILDDKPRPQEEGLLHHKDDDIETLVNLAASVMDLMLEKRLVRQGVGQAGLSFPYDVQRAAVQLRESLHHLKDDSDFQTVANDSHRSLVQSATITADHLLSSVVSMRKNAKQQHTWNASKSLASQSSSVSNTSSSNQNQGQQSGGPADMDCQEDHDDNHYYHPSSSTTMTNTASAATTTTEEEGNRRENPQMPPQPKMDRVGEQTTIQVSKLVHNLVSAMEVFPKKVHLAFVVDPAVPHEIVCNDLKVFRSAIALLTSACERTEQGFVRFHVYKKMDRTPTMIVFECEDTGRDVALEQYHKLFLTPKQVGGGGGGGDESTNDAAEEEEDDDEECISVDPHTGVVHRKAFCQVKKSPISGGFAVYPVAQYVQSMGGEYGYLPRVVRQRSAGDNVPETGSLFWFSIPLREALSSLDAAIGTALGLDDDEERQVVGKDTPDLRLSAHPRTNLF